jgi:hypothetical protein
VALHGLWEGPEVMDDVRKAYDDEVFYRVWRNGGNPDLIDSDRVDDSWGRGYRVDDAAARELRSQRRYRERDDDEL